MDVVAAFNAVEVAWWLFVAVCVGIEGRRSRRACPLTFGLCTVLGLFALSDAIEFHTGAWWRPWWLALLKVGCGTTAGLLAISLYRQNRR